MRQEKRKKKAGEKAKSKSQDCCVTFKPKNYVEILLSAHARTSQADIWHLDQKAAKCTTCKPVCGVADGVGGWRHYGIDSSLFSSALMESCKRFVLEGGLETPSPVSIIKAGFQELAEHKEPLFGSSTACIMVLDKKSQTLHSANLGDSGFLVIRQGSVVHHSSEQQHYFNTPYQLALPPPGQAGTVIQDSLDEAESTSFSVEPGDLIVLATDGLFDNVSTEQILKELSQLEDHSTESIQNVTDSLAHLARTHSFDPNFSSPFSEQARCEGFNITGGKPDDITILIAVVSDMAADDLDT